MEGAPILLQFSFPRTGGHYLAHSIEALYDTAPVDPKEDIGIVWQADAPSASRGVILEGDAEVQDRDRELNPMSRYARSLREHSGAVVPLNHIHGRTGVHGVPGDLGPDERAVVIIRDPVATVFSLYRVRRDRWIPGAPFDADAIRFNFDEYVRFYDAAYGLKDSRFDDVKIVVYEKLVESPVELRDFCNFLGFRPKLEPEFVWHITKFENFILPEKRTFYREGKNDAWKADAAFCAMLAEVPEYDFRRFGYDTIPAYLEAAGRPVASGALRELSEKLG
jgi:hypothetical protein